jgi:hypothetical protein
MGLQRVSFLSPIVPNKVEGFFGYFARGLALSRASRRNRVFLLLNNFNR